MGVTVSMMLRTSLGTKSGRERPQLGFAVSKRSGDRSFIVSVEGGSPAEEWS